ncbi:MAG: S8 family serine peptidase [Acidobacteriota bacterium]
MTSHVRKIRIGLVAKLLLLILFLAALTVGSGLLSGVLPDASAALQQTDDQGRTVIAATAARQIESLVAHKRSFSRVQRKIDSQLIFAIKGRRGQSITREIETLETNVEVGETGLTTVDISTTSTSQLLEKLEAIDAEVINVVPTLGSVRARVRLEQVEEIAALSGVQFIQPKQVAITNGIRRMSNVAERLSTAIAPASEGDTVHLAKQMRTDFGANGSGVRIGVLSDGVGNLSISQARGALGQVTVLPGQTGEGDEGTAMLEIIHALAPSAKLYFATAFTSAASFAENIRSLRQAGCDVIVDDVFYLNESAFQDGQSSAGGSPINGGVIAEAVKDVTASGAMYFSSAGNGGNLAKGTSAVWEGDFRDGGAGFGPVSADLGRIHDFGGGRLTNQITVASPFPVTLQWSDPLGASSNDYDLFILNSAGTSILAASLNFQAGAEDPFEIVAAQPAGRRILVTKYEGEGRFIHVDATRGRVAIATEGQTIGHSTVAAAFSVAATPAFLPFGAPPNPVGPFPGAFNASSKVELFSSDGPRRLFYRGDGTPFTPGNLSSTGGQRRQKPDITAADGTEVTGVGLFPTPFYGTSAAAPHAAAIAALLKSSNPSLTPAQLRVALLSSAIDIEQPGVDSVSGSGIVMAPAAAIALGSSPMADIELGRVVVAEAAGGNGNGFVEPGETGNVTFELKNLGVVAASGIKATLETESPGVFIATNGSVDFANMPARTGAAAGSAPVSFLISSINACDARIFFTLVVTYVGGPSPKRLNFEVAVGTGPVNILTILDDRAPDPGSKFTTATGLQSGRMVRTFIPSTCQPTKPYPGLSATGNRRYDAYTFPTCTTSASTCITVSLTSSCSGIRLFAAAYLDKFDPNDLGANYIGDIGDGPIGGIEELGFTFSVPPGRSFVVVIHELNTNGAVGCQYNLKVSGLCDSCSAANLFCVQDDTTDDSLLFNFLNGDYLFSRCADGLTLAGRGDIGRKAGAITLKDGPRVNAEVEKTPASTRGSAQIRLNSIGRIFSLTDRNILNSSCSCR